MNSPNDRRDDNDFLSRPTASHCAVVWMFVFMVQRTINEHNFLLHRWKILLLWVWTPVASSVHWIQRKCLLFFLVSFIITILFLFVLKIIYDYRHCVTFRTTYAHCKTRSATAIGFSLLSVSVSSSFFFYILFIASLLLFIWNAFNIRLNIATYQNRSRNYITFGILFGYRRW